MKGIVVLTVLLCLIYPSIAGNTSDSCTDGVLTVVQCNIDNGVGIQTMCGNVSISTCNATACDSGYSLDLNSSNLYTVRKTK